MPVRKKYSLFHFPESVEIRIGETLYLTKPDAVLLFGPDEPRWIYFPRDTHFNFIHVTLEAGSLIEKYRLPTGVILYPENPEFLNSCFRKLRMEYLSAFSYTEELSDAYVQELLIRLSRAIHNMGEKTGLSMQQQEQLRRLRLSVLSQPERKWSVEEMARAMSLSASRFHVIYKAMFGVSPVSDLIGARIDRAKLLLLEDESSTLAVIAEKLGYKNPYDFSRQFTKVTGVTPGNYRKNNQ